MIRFLLTASLISLAAAGAEGQAVQDEKKLRLEDHHVDIQIRENVAVLIHTLRIYNPRPVAAEATLLLPGPEGAVAFGLTLRHNVASTQRESKVMSEREARTLYEEVRRRGMDRDDVDVQALAMRFAASRPATRPSIPQDPAILEYGGRNRFSLRVYPVLPHTRQVVTVRLAAPIPSRDARFTIRLPLWVSAPELEIDQTRQPLSLTISSKGRIRAVNLEPAVNGLNGIQHRHRYSGRALHVPEREEVTLSYDVGKGSRHTDFSARPAQGARTLFDRAVLALRGAGTSLSKGDSEEVRTSGLKGHYVTRETSLLVIEAWVARDLRRRNSQDR